ncbi:MULTISPECIES: LysE family translocator [Acetobacterales]|uniref:LysE family translocator n=1 Tax=Roseomonas sp. WGS1072 TaxID=3366816 RepID=UPI003BF343D5
MTITQSLLAFLLAAGLLTVTPGLDTALVLRTATAEGARQAARAAFGINLGCLLWGAAVALGLGALLAASQLAFEALRWAGAAYLCWLGLRLLWRPRERFAVEPAATGLRLGWFARGLLSNLLNPKIGVFYISFLPQFVPAGLPAAPWTFLLAVLHVAMGIAWCAALILASQPLGRLLRRPAVLRWMDRLTGGVFIGFGVHLALGRR